MLVTVNFVLCSVQCNIRNSTHHLGLPGIIVTLIGGILAQATTDSNFGIMSLVVREAAVSKI